MTDSTETIEQTLRISAQPETVWRYWTDPKFICEWWGSSAELDPLPGGICRVEMESGPIMRGEFIELIPHERIVFSFGWEPAEENPLLSPGSTQVEVTLVADGNDTIMTLRHSGLPSTHSKDHESGWTHYLEILAKVAGTTTQG